MNLCACDKIKQTLKCMQIYKNQQRRSYLRCFTQEVNKAHSLLYYSYNHMFYLIFYAKLFVNTMHVPGLISP